MRWNRQERIVGGSVVGAALLVGFVLPPWGAAVICGMSRDQVETLFLSEGTGCKPIVFLNIGPRRPGQSNEEYAKASGEFYRKYWMYAQRYESWGGTVVVTYHIPEGEPRVLKVEGDRGLSWGLVGHLLPWAVIGYLLARAEIARRRLAPSPAPTA